MTAPLAGTMSLGGGAPEPIDHEKLFNHLAAQLDTAGRQAPMRETDADRQVRADAYAVSAEELRQFIERYETLEAEKKDIADQMKEVMAEAKGRGYDTKALRKIIALRKRDKNDLAEEEAVIEVYKAALGMS